jgi:hypothetical protein
MREKYNYTFLREKCEKFSWCIFFRVTKKFRCLLLSKSVVLTLIIHHSFGSLLCTRGKQLNANHPALHVDLCTTSHIHISIVEWKSPSLLFKKASWDRAIKEKGKPDWRIQMYTV